MDLPLDLVQSTGLRIKLAPDPLQHLLVLGVLRIVDSLQGGLSNVEIDGNNAEQIKAIGVVISTFET